MALLRVLFFILPAVAWAQPAQAPPPSKSDIDKAVAFIKADQSMVDMAVRQFAAAMVGQATVQQPAAPPPPAVAPAPAAPVPTIAVVPAPQTITIPAEVRDAVLSLCGILITAAIGAALAWMRTHLAFMKEVGANEAITSSAQGLGALLEQELARRGASLSTVTVNDPTVAAFAQKLIASYPEWGPLVGLTPDIAARKVLGGAIEQSTVPLIPAGTKSEVVVLKPVPPEPAMVAEAAATPQQGSIT